MTFKHDLAIGHSGELELLKLVPSLKRTDGLKHDFETTSGIKIELKYDTTKYNNIFLETVSNTSKNSPGAVYQSVYNEAVYFVYLFSRGDLFIFKTADLVYFLYQNKDKYADKCVKNLHYITIGKAVPIEDLTHLCLPKEVLEK